MNEAHQNRFVFVAVVMPYYRPLFPFLIRLIDYGLCVCLFVFQFYAQTNSSECWNVRCRDNVETKHFRDKMEASANEDESCFIFNFT